MSARGRHRRATPREIHAMPVSRGRTRGLPSVRQPVRRGRPRRSRSAVGVLRTLAILALLIAASAALAAFVLTRPGSVRITTSPTDARITFDGSFVSTGTLEIEAVEPGQHRIEVERAGFASVETTIEVRRLHRTERALVLDPLPQRLAIVTTPSGATATIECSDGTRIEARTPLERQVPAGRTRITLTLAGHNTYTRDVFLDAPLSFEYFLDPEGQLLHGLGTIRTKGAPKGVAVTPDGREIWTSILNGPPSIEIFDVATGRKVGEVDLGKHGAVEVIFNRTGTLAYTSQMETAKCFEIDVRTRKVVRTFDTNSAWTKWVQLSPDERTLYASNWSGDDVSEIDLASGALRRRIRVSDTPRGMYATADGRWLYVAGFDSGRLDRIDLSTGKVEAVFEGGGALRHIVGDERTGRLFISDMAKDLIWVHDVRTGRTTTFAKVDEKPNTIDLTPDGRVLFVSCRGENNPRSYYLPGPEWGSILVFDAGDATPLDALVVGNQPTALDVSTDGRLLVTSDFLDNRLRMYEIPDYETLKGGGGGRYRAHLALIKK